MLTNSSTPDVVNQTSVQLRASAHFADWLAQQALSLAFTTYQSNGLMLVSSSAGRLAVSRRSFDKPMGLYATPDRLFLSTRYQIWQLENVLQPGQTHQGHDRLYVPKLAHTTGDLNVHDVAQDRSGELVFVNTDFSCLARLDPVYSFVPQWQPPFISKLAAEDRCHLNGLAMVDGMPAFATACSTTDTAAGWRDRRVGGGVVLDVRSNQTIATGLSMPHSPRWYREKLWLLNAGTGELGWVQDGQLMPIAFCPGFVRGLAFWQDYALVGLSKLRSRQFTGLPLEQRLAAEGQESQCGLLVIDLNSGAVVHWLHLDGAIEELFDVVVLPGVRQPRILGLEQEDLQRLVTFPGADGVVATKPTVSRPGQTAAPIAGLPASVPQPVKFQSVYHLNPENLVPYAAFLYPNLLKRWQAQPPQGELLGVSAAIAGNLVGMAIAELQPPDGLSPARSAELLSLLVLPECRQQGIGTQLVRHLETLLRQSGIDRLLVRYRATPLTEAGLEPLLRRLGWQASELDFWLCQSSIEAIAAVPWLTRYPLPPEFIVFPWPELSIAEAEALRQQPFPPSLSPFSPDPRLEPLTSLGLRYRGAVVGWVLTHRVAPDTIRYSTMYVAPPHQKLGRGVSLMALAIQRQIQSGIPQLTCAIAADNVQMQRFISRHAQPYLTTFTTARRSQKVLRAGG